MRSWTNKYLQVLVRTNIGTGYLLGLIIYCFYEFEEEEKLMFCSADFSLITWTPSLMSLNPTTNYNTRLTATMALVCPRRIFGSRTRVECGSSRSSRITPMRSTCQPVARKVASTALVPAVRSRALRACTRCVRLRSRPLRSTCVRRRTHRLWDRRKCVRRRRVIESTCRIL